jgi:dTDP-glucose 4,6-dehydratase
MSKTLLVTGGAGFIGSNFIHYVLEKSRDMRIINIDKLTYAGNLDNLKDIGETDRYRFVQGDICDEKLVASMMEEADMAVNFAAETHVDRSLMHGGSFINTDVYGTYVLLEAARNTKLQRFIQISTDEVYGSIESGSFSETDVLNPRNPYSASKAGADRLAFSFFATYGLDVIITRASNNFGPYQHPEKVIPLFISNAIDDIPLPLYGDGLNVRDWLYVEDHCAAIFYLLEKGAAGEVYNIGGGNEMTNIEITRRILAALEKPESLIKPVKDRLGHDRRYSLSIEKIGKLGWTPAHDFAEALSRTVKWYAGNEWWWRKVKDNKRFADYYRTQYEDR